MLIQVNTALTEYLQHKQQGKHNQVKKTHTTRHKAHKMRERTDMQEKHMDKSDR